MPEDKPMNRLFLPGNSVVNSEEVAKSLNSLRGIKYHNKLTPVLLLLIVFS